MDALHGMAVGCIPWTMLCITAHRQGCWDCSYFEGEVTLIQYIHLQVTFISVMMLDSLSCPTLALIHLLDSLF
jgi:hypothetical protein